MLYSPIAGTPTAAAMCELPVSPPTCAEHNRTSAISSAIDVSPTRLAGASLHA